MREDTRRRRRELCALKFRGVPLDSIAKRLGEKYNIKSKYINRDWYNRKEWIGEVFDVDLSDPEFLILDILSEQKEIKDELWKMERDTNNENIALGALKQIKDVGSELLNMLQSIGVIEKVAQKHELTGEGGGPILIDNLDKVSDEVLIREAKKYDIDTAGLEERIRGKSKES
jgi:hypothetical protein